MKKRKFADGGETTEMLPSAKPEGGRFDEDTYARARRAMSGDGGKEVIKTAAKKARKVETDPTAGEAKDKVAQRAADRMGDSPSRPARMPGKLAGMVDARPLAKSVPKTSMYPEATGKEKQAKKFSDVMKAVDSSVTSSKYAKGGSIDGIAQRGKTRGKVC